MDSAKTLHSVRSKKRELRAAQRESKKKVEKIKEVGAERKIHLSCLSCNVLAKSWNSSVSDGLIVLRETFL